MTCLWGRRKKVVRKRALNKAKESGREGSNEKCHADHPTPSTHTHTHTHAPVEDDGPMDRCEEGFRRSE